MKARGAWSTVAGTAVALGALATWNSAHKSLWIDEAYSEYASRLSVLGALRRGVYYELQSPLYFGVLALWRDLNRSVMFGRALSTVAAMALVIVMAGIARRAALARWWLLAVACAVLPGVVWAASELRGYALTLLLTALTFYFFLGITRDTTRVSRTDLVGYVLSAVALLYSFYYGGFVLAGQWVAAVVAKRRVPLVTGLLAVVGCALAPMIRIIAMQVSQHPIETPVDLAGNFRYALFTTSRMAIGAFEGRARIPTWPHVTLIFLAIAIGVPLVRTARSRVPWDREEAALTLAAFLPIVVLALLRLSDIAHTNSQHFLIALPGLLLIYGIWIDRTAIGWPRIGEASVVLGLAAICLLDYQRGGVQREDWRGAARYVAQHAAAGDLVLLYDPDRTLPFNDYFQPIAPTISVHGVPVDINLETYDPFAYAIRDTAMVATRLGALNGLSRPVWFVTASELLGPLRNGPELVLTYLGAHDHLDPPVTLDGVRIIHAEPIPPAAREGVPGRAAGSE